MAQKPPAEVDAQNTDESVSTNVRYPRASRRSPKRSVTGTRIPAPSENEKRVFGSRPKLDGLWVRLTFRDGEVLEGVIQNDLLLMGSHGVTFTPPDATSNTQRIFVPQRSLQELKVLSVIGSPVHRRQSRPKTPPREQIDLFSGRVPS